MAGEKKGTEGDKLESPTPDKFAAEQVAGITGGTGAGDTKKELKEDQVVAPQDDLVSVLKRCQELGLTVSIGTGKQLVLSDDENYDDIPEPEPEKNEPKFRIRIDEQDNSDNNSDVFVAVNGMPYLIKRGFDVVVPKSVVGVLDDAVITTVTKDPKGGDDVVRHIKRFAMRILEEVKSDG
jgi:hypothetical protein